MIIVELKGGFGNQLFQYAAALNLARHHNVPVKVDVRKLLLDAGAKDTNRKYELLNIIDAVEVAQEEERNIKTGLLKKIMQRLKPPHLRQPYKEPHFEFDKNFLNAKSNAFLKGYWQTEKYFYNIKTEVRVRFQIKDELINHLDGFKKQLKFRNTVALHVRRKDYLKPGAFEYHGVLDETYYLKAIETIHSKIEDPYFIVFSDDPDWVKQNFKFHKEVLYMSNEISTSAISDFHLISFCKHQIIANSTFSWWAAYLNPNPDKIVIAPKRWFNKAPYDTKDLIPEGWIRI